MFLNIAIDPRNRRKGDSLHAFCADQGFNPIASRRNICILPHDKGGDIEAAPKKDFYVSRFAFVDFGISNRIDIHAEAFLSIFRP
jgi:hypothetical protein